MPDVIYRNYDSPTHWLVERIAPGEGKTACGRILKGITGGAIAPLIDCKKCKAALRKEGWQV